VWRFSFLCKISDSNLKLRAELAERLDLSLSAKRKQLKSGLSFRRILKTDATQYNIKQKMYKIK
jgi:hypothetical protein